MKKTIKKLSGKIKRVVVPIGKLGDKLESKLKGVSDARKARDKKIIEENWGSVDSYHMRMKR